MYPRFSCLLMLHLVAAVPQNKKYYLHIKNKVIEKQGRLFITMLELQ